MFAAPWGWELGSAGVAQVEEKRKGRGGGRWKRRGAVLLITAQKLNSQGDALLPLPRQDTDKAGVERRLKDVVFVDVVIAVAWKDLERGQQPIRVEQSTVQTW